MPRRASAKRGRVRWTGRRGLAAAVAATALMAVALFATPATASPYGQLESWGSYGTGDGELTSPLMAGLDSSDGSVYVGDLSEIGEASGDRDHYRIQKLSPSGEFEGSTLIPRYENIPSNTRILTLFGIAVDPELERLYVLQGGRQNGTFGELVAKRILVFSTNPVAGELVPPAGGPESLPLPTDNTNGLFKPRGIEVDPSNGDLVIMAEKRFSPKYTVFQRFSSSGEAGAKFTDEENTLRPGFEEAKVFTVGPEGTIYSMTGRPSEVGIGHTRAFEIPSSMESVSAIPGFAAAAESEEWPYGFQSGGASTPQSGLASGPEIAVSPDGETLYWKEQIAKSLSEENEPGNVLVRGFSLGDLATTVVYGDGPGECRIETSPAGLRAIGEKVVVFDYGPLQEEEAPAPAFGPKVKTFGPGGGGCLEPVAKFKANGVEGDVEITEGETVEFDASPSELKSGPGETEGFRQEVIWDFGDGEQEVVKAEGETQAGLTASHEYATSGEYEATLRIRFKNPDYGNPLPVSHGVSVAVGAQWPLTVTKAGTGSGTVTSEPAGIDCGSDCSEEYGHGTVVKLTGTPDIGSEPVEWDVCPGTVNEAGQCVVTVDAAKEAVASFELETPSGECTGSDIVSEGPTLQELGQAATWIPGFQGPGGACFEKGSEPTVEYLTVGDAGFGAWDFNGPDETPFDTSRAFTAADGAPDATQIENAESASGAGVVVIPVAQTAIGVVVNPPADCEVGQITNKQLESIFRGNLQYWGKIRTSEGPGCAGEPITRVVRAEGSGVTLQFKDYLYRANKGKLLCTESQTWRDLEPIGSGNTVWPQGGLGGCPGSALSDIVTAPGGLVSKVNSEDGSIGYAPLPDVEAAKEGDTEVLALQNNGLRKLANATFADPATPADGANCDAADYRVPEDARVGGGSGEGVDWSRVFGADILINGENYPLCALAFDMALSDYSAAGMTAGQAATAADYLGYVAGAAGQADIDGAKAFYAALPGSVNPILDVRGAAALAASKIGF